VHPKNFDTSNVIGIRRRGRADAGLATREEPDAQQSLKLADVLRNARLRGSFAQRRRREGMLLIGRNEETHVANGSLHIGTICFYNGNHNIISFFLLVEPL
jgi:hypothetical protein